MDDNFLEFVDYVENNDVYMRIPRIYIRDVDNPLEAYSNQELIQRYRFSRDTMLNIILPLIYPNNQVVIHRRGLPIPPVLKMCTALRFYASGCYQRMCGDVHNLGQSTICRIIKEVSELFSLHLAQFVKFPQNVQEQTENKRKVYQIARFPGVVGCIDCTHVEIKSPGGHNAEVYRNRKGWFSLNVQVICGPRGEFLDIVVRWPGSAHDARIFNNSSVKLRFDNRYITGIMLGDSAYPQSNYLFTPVRNPTTPVEQRYNSSHIRTRNIIERSFGQWKQRFRCLSKMLSYKLRTVNRIIVATAILHNIAIERRELLFEENDVVQIMVPNPQIQENVRGQNIRNNFIIRHFQH